MDKSKLTAMLEKQYAEIYIITLLEIEILLMTALKRRAFI